MSRPWNPSQSSLKVIENDTIRSGTHNFLLTFHSNIGLSRAICEINNNTPVYFVPPLTGSP